MLNDEVIAPDGKSWYVSIPPDRDRAVFCRPAGSTWQLYRFARGEHGATTVLRSIALEHGQVETAIVMLDTEVEAQ
ncbi:MAG: hypothetical protein ACLQMF_09060 [Rectinemataceae bacterium]